MTQPRPIRETKLQSVCLELTELVQRLGPEAKFPTIRELAESLPASVATINQALQELEAQGLVVRRHGVGIFVAPHLPRQRIALICRPEFFQAIGSSPFWGLLLEHAKQRATEHKEELQLFFTDDNFSPSSFHGVIGIGLEYCVIKRIVAGGLPVVAFAGPGAYAVGFDHDLLLAQGRAALESLGCQRILEIPSTESAPSKQYEAYLWGQRLFTQPQALWPDGVLSGDDMLTAGFLGAVHEAGVALGEVLQLATHANAGSPTLLGWEPKLIQLEVSPKEIIEQLFDLLEAQLRREAPREPAEQQVRKVAIRTRFSHKLRPLPPSEKSL